MPVSLYRIWCETEAAFVTQWANAEPTVCPNNPADTIDAAKTSTIKNRVVTPIAVDPVMEPIEPGSAKVIANDRPAIEVQDAVTGFAAIQSVWPLAQLAEAEMCIAIKFILKAAGTGSKVRLGMKYKTQAVGEDSSAAFDEEGFVVVDVTYTTVGEVFEGMIILPAGQASKDDAVALQFGRDGNNEMGAGTNDDVNVPVQIISIKAEAM
jgi:hypothetical protein